MSKIFLTLKRKVVRNTDIGVVVDLEFETSIYDKIKYKFYMNALSEHKAKKYILDKIYKFKIKGT